MSKSKLATIWFPKEEEPYYRKAIVARVDLEWWLGKGGSQNQPAVIAKNDPSMKEEANDTESESR